MADKGSKLNKRVWRLFERAGFSTRPNSSNPSEEVIQLEGGKTRTVDLSAVDRQLGVKIIGWNKARKDFSESFTVHLHDYERLRDIAKANTVLFVSTEREIPQADRDYAKKLGMNVWGKEELEYYEAVVDAIGEYAKYEIIHSMGITTDEEKHIHNVLALKLRQPLKDSPSNLFLFSATPELLLRTSVVLRKASIRKDAYQRILQKKRLAQIKRFVTQPDALLPTNIIVHFGDNVRWENLPVPEKDAAGKSITISKRSDCELVLLSIPSEYASLELIDGQHRLFGFVQADPATKQTFNLIVLGMADIQVERRTETFVAINDNARRMDANLVAFLKFTEDESACQKDNLLMAIKIVVELSRITPFKDKIRLLDVGKQRITLKGFAGYDLKGLLGEKGLLRKHYMHQSSSYVSALRLYFNILKSLFPDQWKDPDKYIIFTNRGISAFLKLLKSLLKTSKKPLDPKTVKVYLKPLKDKWPKKQWETAQLRNSYVGSKGWKDFHRDLVETIQKVHKSFLE
jgi:DGQHR domain-containing protein